MPKKMADFESPMLQFEGPSIFFDQSGLPFAVENS
jgi:hypothetical protein